MRTAEQLRYLVLALQREGNRQLTSAFKSINLTPSQAEVIRVVGEHGPLNLGRIGEVLICESGGNPSRLVNRLVIDGLIERKTALGDRRNLQLSLTKAGYRSFDLVKEIEEQFYDEIEGDASLRHVDLISGIDFLHAMIGGASSGKALEKRIEMTKAASR